MKFKKLVLAAALLTSMGAKADFIIDVDTNNANPVFAGVADPDSQTAVFQTFILNELSPVSQYLDMNGDGKVNNGEFVYDVGQTRLTGLSTADRVSLTGFADLEGLGSSWYADVSWELFGVAGVVEGVGGDGGFDGGAEVLGAQFFGGSLIFDIKNGLDDSLLLANAIVMSVTGSSPVTVPFGLGFNIFGAVSSVGTWGSGKEFLVDQNGDSLGVIPTDSETFISVVANTDLSELDKVPLADGTTFSSLNAGAQSVFNTAATAAGVVLDGSVAILTRSTDVGSVDIRPSAVPEPTTLAFLGFGLAALGFRARRNKA